MTLQSAFNWLMPIALAIGCGVVIFANHVSKEMQCKIKYYAGQVVMWTTTGFCLLVVATIMWMAICALLDVSYWLSAGLMALCVFAIRKFIMELIETNG